MSEVTIREYEAFNASISNKIKDYKLRNKSVTASVSEKEEKNVWNYLSKYNKQIYSDLATVFEKEQYSYSNKIISEFRYWEKFLQSIELEERLNIREADLKLTKKLINNILIIHVLVRMDRMMNFEHKEIISYADIEKYSKEGDYWYRGQSSFSWNMVPSYYRSLGAIKTCVDDEYLKEDYSKLQITQKLHSFFNGAPMDYEQLAFVQHSLAITPLLDFTKNIYSATSFAVSNFTTARKLTSESASIFRLNLDEKKVIKEMDDATNIIKKLNVDYMGTNPYVSTIIKSKFWLGFISGDRVSEYYLFDIATNDRMRIQNGTFVLFDNVMYIGDVMLYSNPGEKRFSDRITKFEIKKDNRYAVYKEIIKNNPRYHLDKMMEPYLYMVS